MTIVLADIWFKDPLDVISTTVIFFYNNKSYGSSSNNA